MTKVLVPIADGTEEIEAITIIDILRRADIEVTVASAMAGRKTVITAHGVKIESDVLLEGCSTEQWDAIAIPGGIPGADHLGNSSVLIAMLKDMFSSGRLVAAICASPAVVLAENALINGYEATCYPAFQERLQNGNAVFEDRDVVEQDNLITSKGPGTAMQFALALVERLVGAEMARKVAADALV